jgi:hypothetical protein
MPKRGFNLGLLSLAQRELISERSHPVECGRTLGHYDSSGGARGDDGFLACATQLELQLV